LLRKSVFALQGCEALVILALGPSCSSQSASHVALPSFDDVTAAPAAIQTAARAVVRIGTSGEEATGSFISPTGLMLTNNHVLGVEICPREGCFAQITQMHQRGSEPMQPVTVYVVPIAVDVGLDMAVVQLYVGSSASSGQLQTPYYLTIDSHDPASLVGQHVNIVGHPEGDLKKWSPGEVVDTDGSWIETTAYILPGNSGSPVLDDEGHLVALMHRGPSSQDLFSADGADEYSLGTASSALIAAMGAPLPATMRSVAEPVTDEDVVTYQDVYRNAQVSTAMVGGVAKPVLDSLGAACDAALAQNDYVSPEDLMEGLAPCTAAEQWIECRSDASSSFGVCPADADAWRQRYKSVNDRSVALNGQLLLDEVTFAPAALEASTAAGQSVASANLTAALAADAPPLDFGLATYLAAFAVDSYAGTRVIDYVRGYANVPGYALSASDIVNAALWLADAGTLSRSQLVSLLQALAADPSVDVGSKLYIEEIQYNSGLL
jgi:V8-like Glu-specific endopeptidase